MKCVLCSSKEELLKNGIGAIIEKQRGLYLLNSFDVPNGVEYKHDHVGTICFNREVLCFMTTLYLNDLNEKLINDGSPMNNTHIYIEMIHFLQDNTQLKIKPTTHMTLCLIQNLKRILILSFEEYYQRVFAKYENIEIQDIVDVINEIKEFIDFIEKLIELKDPIISDVVKTEYDNDAFLAKYLNNAVINDSKYTLDKIDVSPEEGKIQLIDIIN